MGFRHYTWLLKNYPLLLLVLNPDAKTPVSGL
jgi:hypothetical protein